MIDIPELFSTYQDGRFQIDGELGEGAMATVWLAHDTVLDIPRAIKVVKPLVAANPKLRKRFLREARIMARLNHPHSVQVYDFGEIGGLPFLVMEYLSGGTIKDFLLSKGVLPPRIAVEVIKQVLSALDALHALDGGRFVHRDIKADNILLTADGIPKLGDFGVAHDDDDGMTKDASQLGTPSYMAMELWVDAKSADARTDLYAMAVTLYACLVGIDKLERNTGGAIRQRAELREGIPDALMEIILKGTENRQAKRFQSAVEMQFALRAAEPTLPEVPMDCKWPGYQPPVVPHGATMVPPEHFESAAAEGGGVAVAVQGSLGVRSHITHVEVLASQLPEEPGDEVSQHAPDPFVGVGNSETLFGEDPLTEEVHKKRKKRFVFIPVALLLAGVFGGVAWWILREPVHDVEAIHESPDVQESVVQAVGGIHESPDVHGSSDPVLEPDPEPEVIEAPVPKPEPVVVQTVPDPDPVHVPDPEPVVRAVGGIHESPEANEEPEVPPGSTQSATGFVSFTGAKAVWMIGANGKTALPADLPPDVYQIDADFGSGPFQAGDSIEVKAGESITLSCDADFAWCER